MGNHLCSFAVALPMFTLLLCLHCFLTNIQFVHVSSKFLQDLLFWGQFSVCSYSFLTQQIQLLYFFFPVSYSASCYFPGFPPPLPPPSVQNSAGARSTGLICAVPLVLLLFCFLHCFLLIYPWKGNNKQRGSWGRRQYGHTSRNRKAKVLGDGQQLDIQYLSSPYLFCCFLLSINCHSVSIFEDGQRGSHSKTSQFQLLCLQSEASKCKSKLYGSLGGVG